ncbi:DNA alkylation repair protein [Niallia sp. 03133]|uniref:DNA alkylation repair protein n=1 Tax=Niallia sp. 03133 TaxID=3458060 RepID=UPI0040449030
MEPLKNIYNQTFIERLGKKIKQQCSFFDEQLFCASIYQKDWEELALKERMRRITISMHEALPLDYEDNLACFYNIAPSFKGLGGIIFPDYVEVYGLNNWEQSIAALEFLTEYSTSEFAVRPFLLKDQERMLEQMQIWTQSENEHVRRLASEGCRPRLPWGMSIPSLKKDPSPVLPVLEALKTDESLYVRKSVANNLNDISKTHPDLVIDLATAWHGENTYTNWIVKHACRTMLKKGEARVLAIFGYDAGESVELTSVHCEAEQVSIGESISFSFEVFSSIQKKIRVEYAIDYVKANGKRSRKVFHLSETVLEEGKRKRYFKTHSFKDLTTRRHYPGNHTLTVILNGKEKASFNFDIHMQTK